jgi:Protein of unknown function (DUF1688)
LETILSPVTIRARTKLVLDAARNGQTHFILDESKLPTVVDFVLDVTKKNYPDSNIPFHGRYEHFRAGGVDRVARLEKSLANVSPIERAKSLIDSVVVSVLLDAGAGNSWKYIENGTTYSRSEGLAVASVAMFETGSFSDDGKHLLQANASALEKITPQIIATGFQVSESNPLLGLDGRSSLLSKLASSMRAFPDLFPRNNPRPGDMLDVLLKKEVLKANDILKHLLIGLSKMWLARSTVENIGFGDVWNWNGTLIPFHKLSQWLTYSLIEPIESAGKKVTGVEELTGLPEYRNGGLFLDFEVLKLRDQSLAKRELSADENVIIEWRALTVQLLDAVGLAVQKKLSKTPSELPLARILQGGTWSAGREIAKLKRTGGVPPLNLKSDGMVF